MDRLTMPCPDGTFVECDPIDIADNDYSKTNFAKVLARLGEYENAEERGLLVRLPCKVGDKVYRINEGDCHSNWKPYIEELTVTVVGYVREHKEVVLTIVAGGIQYKEKNFGKTVFLTREEAEKALRGREPFW